MKVKDYPLVSVVMAVHNACVVELEKSCNSILNQTYPNIEFIIIDDVNSECVCNFLEVLDSEHKNVLIIKNPQNLGLTFSLVSE